MLPALATKLAASSRAACTTFMSRTEVVVSEVKSKLRSRARITMLLVATRVWAWALPAASRTRVAAMSERRMSVFLREWTRRVMY
ncbi:hypothetical protein D3C78_1257800 [compost metagenome]